MTQGTHDPMQYFHDLTCEAGHPQNAADVVLANPLARGCACDVRRDLAKAILLESERYRRPRKGFLE